MLKKIFKNSLFVIIASLSLGLAANATFAQGANADWSGKTVYNKVNLKAQFYPKDGFYKMYSTGYYGVPDLFPINTKFQVTSLKSDMITLKPEGKDELRVYYVAKHSGDQKQWMSDYFSFSPVKLPKTFTKRELELIKAADFEVGMSREALFHSIGYPPKSLSASRTAPTLTYEAKRFNKTAFNFDDKDKIAKITK